MSNDDATREQRIFAREELVPLESIRVLENPRKRYDKEALRELADSIRDHGLIQSPVVKEAGAGNYELIAGSRRFRAVELLRSEHPLDPRFQTIRVSVQEHASENLKVIQIIENVKRADLTLLEQVAAVADLKTSGMDEERIAKELGYTKRHIQRMLSIFGAPDWLRECGDRVSVEEPRTDKEGNRVLENNKPVFTTKTYPALSLADLYEVVAFYNRVDAWDHKQTAANDAHRPKAESVTRGAVRKIVQNSLSRSRLIAFLEDRFNELTGAPARQRPTPAVARAPVTVNDNRLTIDVSELAEPLPQHELLRVKEDLVRFLTKLGYQNVRLS
jgi:ParB/RepB/Spo0J family partition protein